MKIVLTANPIEKIFSQCAVCFLPNDVRPLRGAIGMVDWAMNGLVTELLQTGKISGEFLESTLIRPDRLLACEKLLIMGIGPFSECKQEKIQFLGKRLIHVLANLHVRDISLSYPMPNAGYSPDIFAEYLTRGFFLEENDNDIQVFLEDVNLAISCVFEQIDLALLGIQKVKVDLKRHFRVIVLE